MKDLIGGALGSAVIVAIVGAIAQRRRARVDAANAANSGYDQAFKTLSDRLAWADRRIAATERHTADVEAKFDAQAAVLRRLSRRVGQLEQQIVELGHVPVAED